MRHPNSYLPRYNIHSETDGENAPLTGNTKQRLSPFNNSDCGSSISGLANNGPHQQIIESEDEEDVPSYGFPSQKNRRNRRNPSDIDLLISNGGKLINLFFFIV